MGPDLVNPEGATEASPARHLLPSEVPIVVTSRMNSSRLPGKALAPIAGEPLLARVVDQCRHSRESPCVVVATSDRPGDQPIIDLCQAIGVECFTGALQDLTSRLSDFVDTGQYPAVVRISGDSPVLDPALIDHGLRLFNGSNVDLVTNVWSRTFPKGQSVEVIRADLLRDLASRDLPLSHREHVTSAVYGGLVPARVRNFTVAELAPEYSKQVADRGIDLSFVNLSVDTLEDSSNLAQVIRSILPLTPVQAGWTQCAEALLQLAVEAR